MEALKFEIDTRLKSAILDIQESISEKVERINQGGCGVFALAMHQELKKYGINSRLAILNKAMEDSDSLEYKRTILNNIANNGKVNVWDARNTSFSHCCLILDNGDSFDGLNWGVIPDWANNGYPYIGDYSEFEMKLALRWGGWNDWYDRKNDHLVKRLIKKNLNKYLN